jgi:hypothetical protein
VTFGLGNSAAVERAVAASRGSEVRIMEDARVRGRSGSWEVESGMALLLSAGVEEREGFGDGDDIFCIAVVSCYGLGREFRVR